jgi:hypothetical protein
MLRTLSVLLLLGLAMPVTDVMAQSSAGRGAVGGAIIGGAVGGRRGAAIGGRHGRRCGSPSRQAWPLLLASWSLLGARWRKIASRIVPLLPVTTLARFDRACARHKWPAIARHVRSLFVLSLRKPFDLDQMSRQNENAN